MATAKTDNNGSKTPVIKNPTAAVPQFAPANCPRCSGKIKFPAPKNNPNSKEATTKYSFQVNLRDVRFFILFPPKIQL